MKSKAEHMGKGHMGKGKGMGKKEHGFGAKLGKGRKGGLSMESPSEKGLYTK